MPIIHGLEVSYKGNFSRALKRQYAQSTSMKPFMWCQFRYARDKTAALISLFNKLFSLLTNDPSYPRIRKAFL